MKTRKVFILITLLVIIVTVSYGVIVWCFILPGDRGVFGDMFGALTALFSGLAFAGIIFTILLQKEELELQRQELKLTRKEFELTRQEFIGQNVTLRKQRFENTFFNLLNYHTRIIEGLYYYDGQFNPPNNPEGKPVTTFIKTDFSKDGLHKILLNRNKPTIDKINELEAKYKKREIADATYKRLAIEAKGKMEALTVLIKADDKAVYKNVIDAIDELNICNVGKYAIVDMSQQELDILNTIKKK